MFACKEFREVFISLDLGWLRQLQRTGQGQGGLIKGGGEEADDGNNQLTAPSFQLIDH